MRRLEIKEGEKFNKLTIMKEVEQRGYQRYVLCECECGNKKEMSYHKVKDGQSKSCGCSILNNSGQFNKGITPHNKIYGDSIKGSKHYYIHRLWCRIKRKCYNPNDHKYYIYGARGIRMYEPWINDYVLFKTWVLENLGERPEGSSLDRIDVNGNYEPSNLRWATASLQAYNRRPRTNKRKKSMDECLT